VVLLVVLDELGVIDGLLRLAVRGSHDDVWREKERRKRVNRVYTESWKMGKIERSILTVSDHGEAN
jgi:hypothetical protein